MAKREKQQTEQEIFNEMMDYLFLGTAQEETRIAIKDLRVGDSIKQSKEKETRIQKIVECPSRWRNHRHIHLSNGKVECWWNEATVRIS
jgi:hypothetical protein